MTDLFDFWSQIERGAHIHPADVKTFDRMYADRHGFQLNCLPGCFAGKLKSAPVVLLFLSPGFAAADVDDANTEDGKDYRFRSWQGDEPFRDHGPGRVWLASRTKPFGDYETIKDKFALLNIGAYHSKDVKSYASLLALPSSRVSLTWAQERLFPDAEAGKRIVLCMRSAAYWGLDTGRSYGKGLFAPLVNRMGHLFKTDENKRLIELVRERVS
jgi:hypothetical protein